MRTLPEEPPRAIIALHAAAAAGVGERSTMVHDRHAPRPRAHRRAIGPILLAVDPDPEAVADAVPIERPEAVVQVVAPGRARVDRLLDGVPLVRALLHLQLDELPRRRDP